MQNKVILINKKIGETPLSCIKRHKESDSFLTNIPMTYAGRLDPLASGLLILLVGDECLKKDEYLNLDKEYEFEVLFGFETDTFDLMGIVKEESLGVSQKNLDLLDAQIKSGFNDVLRKFIGKIKQSYPPYSSRPVLGKPLFKWAREGKINEIEIPTHDVFIKNIIFLEEKEIQGDDLLEKIKKEIGLVSGDFRQDIIIKNWENILSNNLSKKYKIAKFRVSCSSGVYVRVLAHDIGKEMKIPSLACSIKRTKIGDYNLLELE